MILRGVAQPYATALLEAASKSKIAEEVLGDLKSLRETFSKNPNLKNFLWSPQVLTESKKAVVKNTLEGRASDLSIRFLLLLIDKKRLFYFDEIVEAYTYLYEREVGIMEVKAITAVPLEKSRKMKLTAKLERETGKRIRLVPVVEPNIIGGMILIMDDKIIDGSIRHQLTIMKRKLEELRV